MLFVSRSVFDLLVNHQIEPGVWMSRVIRIPFFFQDLPVDTKIDLQVEDRRNEERTLLLRTTGVAEDRMVRLVPVGHWT